MQDWYPEALVDIGNNAGDYTDNGEPKGLLHTTEGKSYASARAAYVTNNSWPHATCTYERGYFQIFQHNPISLASRALKNLSGGVETNRDRIVQLEIVGTADVNNANSWGEQYVENFPKDYLDGIARWMRWVEEQLGVPRISTVIWKKYPDSYGSSNGIRLSPSEFDMYSGWLGHQHAAENSHGDPGLLDINYLLDAEEDDLPYTEDQLNDIMRQAVREEFTSTGTPTRTAVLNLMIRGIQAGAHFLAIPDDFDTGEDVYYTDLFTKIQFEQGSELHNQIKADLAANGLATTARELPRAVIDAIPFS